jgi:hypothetical protein
MTAAPTFIVGNGHSGTTLLSRILGNHPNLYSPPGETAFFECLDAFSSRLSRLSDGCRRKTVLTTLAAVCSPQTYHAFEPFESDFLDRLDPGRLSELCSVTDSVIGATDEPIQDPERLFGEFMDYYARISGKEGWVEKTPEHLYYVDRIKGAYPRARIVHIIRDPRDLLCSYKLRETQRRDVRDSFLVFYDPLTILLAWKSAIRAGNRLASRYPDDYKEIRFEDLVYHPDSVLEDLSAFIGQAFDSSMLDVRPYNPALPVKGSQRFNRETVGRWKQHLASSEVAFCHRVCALEAESKGYVFDGRKLGLLRALPFCWVSLGRSASRIWAGRNALDRLTLKSYVGKQVRRLASLF